MSHALSSCIEKQSDWLKKCSRIKDLALDAFSKIDYTVYGSTDASTLPNTLSISFADIDAEALILTLRDTAEIATGSACTSESYTPSHVLMAMGLTEDDANKVVRLSWGMTSNPNIFKEMAIKIKELI